MPALKLAADRDDIDERAVPSTARERAMPIVLMHRVAHALHRARVPLVPKLCALAARLLFHGYVGPGARIGARVSLGYWGLGIVIHDRAVLGDDVRVGPHVVIGGRSKMAEVPVIGDRVVIGAGATILGPVRVGDEAVIGANAVVVADVPSRAVVGGVPARVLKRDIDVRDYHDGFERAPARSRRAEQTTRV